MKASPDGKYIGCSTSNLGVELFNFNAQNGSITLNKTVASNSTLWYYGLEFSPNSNYLFFTFGASSSAGLLSYNISTPANPPVTLSAAPSGALQYAPDGNIYAARRQLGRLARISNPNSGGVYTEYGLVLAPGTSAYAGLPNFSNFTTPPANCPVACFDFTDPRRLVINTESRYGPVPVHEMCEPTIPIDGSCSINEDRYYLSIGKFDLAAWTSTMVYSGWVCTSCTVPNFTTLSSYLGGPPVVNQVYIVTLAVGPVWHATTKFFLLKDCGLLKMSEVGLGELSGEDNGAAGKFTLYPNPGSGVFHLDFEKDYIKQITVRDAYGNTVLKNANVNGRKGVEFDLGDRPDGFYFVHLGTTDKVIIKKLVKK